MKKLVDKKYVKCIDNSALAEGILVVGKVYQVVGENGFVNTFSDGLTDYKLKGVKESWLKSRFVDAPAPKKTNYRNTRQEACERINEAIDRIDNLDPLYTTPDDMGKSLHEISIMLEDSKELLMEEK
jgi:hypothetical protein